MFLPLPEKHLHTVIWRMQKCHTFQKPAVGVIEGPHGQFLQRQHMICFRPYGFHLCWQEHS